MADNASRSPVRVRFRFNVETGEIEEFLIDDNSPALSEDYHDKVAGALAGQLVQRPRIQDAGPRSGAALPPARVEPGTPEERRDKDAEV